MKFSALWKSIRNALSFPGDSLSQPSGWISRLLAMSETSSGVAINEENCLAVSDFYKCDRVRRESIAALPLKVYRNLPRGREEAKDHPLYFLLHDEPNPHMTSFTWVELLVSNLGVWNRHFTYIERNRAGRIVGLWPIRPDMCRLEVIDGQMWFFARRLNGVEVKFWDDEILYIPGPSRDGYFPYRPIMQKREALGLAKALELFGGKFFGNGSHAGGFLEHPGQVSAEAAKRLKESFQEKHSGLDNAHRLAVLEEGMQFKPNTIPPETAQFLQSREFQRGEIAGLERIPPHKIGDLSRSTNNNIEHQALEFYTDSLAPVLERIEQAFNRVLLMPFEKGKFFVEFDADGLMRGDTASQIAYFKGMFSVGAMSENDIRLKKNMPPIEGGDRYYVPLNMVPIDMIDTFLAGKNKLNASTAAPGQRILQSSIRFFRDAMGRVLNRKAAERVKYAETAFLQPVFAVVECVCGEMTDGLEAFATEWAGKMAASSASWGPEMLEEDALGREVQLCIDAALLRGAN
jgi:HK97 family phage portal protein